MRLIFANLGISLCAAQVWQLEGVRAGQGMHGLAATSSIGVEERHVPGFTGRWSLDVFGLQQGVLKAKLNILNLYGQAAKALVSCRRYVLRQSWRNLSEAGCIRLHPVARNPNPIIASRWPSNHSSWDRHSTSASMVQHGTARTYGPTTNL